MEETKENIKHPKRVLFMIVLVFLLIGIGFIYTVNTATAFIDNQAQINEKKAFQEGSEFICTDGYLGHLNARIIAYKSGWAYGEKYLKKEDKLINKKNCTLQDARSLMVGAAKDQL